MIISPTVTLLAVAPLTSITVGNLLDVCQGFTAPTKYSFSRTLPVLRFKEDEDTVVATSPEAVAKAILQNEVILPSLDDGDVATTMGLGLGVLEQEPVLDVLPNKLTSGESLHPISFEDDIEKFLDIAKPYYALGNEYAIVDDETGEMVGFVCTGRVESPVSRESGDEVSTSRPELVVIWQQLDPWLPFFVTHKRRGAFMISYHVTYLVFSVC